MKKLVKLFFAIILISSSSLLILSCYNSQYLKEEIVVCNNDYDLNGELILPSRGDNFPAVVIVPGSGPMDMDGTTNSQKPYKYLTQQLALNGIASIRFNKVSYQYNNEIASDIHFTIEDEYFYAITSCIDILKNNAKIDKNNIYLIGHSFGSQIIPIFLNDDSSLAGGIIMAGTTMHILDLILQQIKKQSEELYQEYLPYCEYAKSLTEVPNGEESYFYFGAYSAYYVSYNALNRYAIKDVNCPIMIMQGGLDLQIETSHFENYMSLLDDKTNVSYCYYENLNHLFSSGIGETINNAYQKSNAIDDNVIKDIVAFIKQ